jgi:signal transduction histidine kinase
VKNLVENAIKYTAEGGDIRLRAYTENGALEVSVEDTGIGIALEEQERVFERFYRVERSRGSGSGGSGLGLALVKDIASIFGGRISLESELGRGSLFTLTLPLESEKKQHE